MQMRMHSLQWTHACAACKTAAWGVSSKRRGRHDQQRLPLGQQTHHTQSATSPEEARQQRPAQVQPLVGVVVAVVLAPPPQPHQ